MTEKPYFYHFVFRVFFCFKGDLLLRKKVLIAVGDKAYTDILKETFERFSDGFALSSQEVFHRRFLDEIVEVEKPDLLILHDYYLESDLTGTEEREQELLSFIREYRLKHDDSFRFVFMCERPKGDLFLTKLVSLGVWDIFNDNSFDLDLFIEQLQKKPHFANVEKFLVTESVEPISVTGSKKSSEKEPQTDKVEKPERPVIQKVVEKKVVQKVVEKKVVQKVVNKNVIKRDYKIQITNQSEKVVGVPLQKKLILIGNLHSRGGSTFISHLLARTLSKMGITTTYIESPFSKPYTFDRFSGHQQAGSYRSRFYQLTKNPLTVDYQYEWTVDDVDLICKHPTQETNYSNEELTFDHIIKILFTNPSIVTIMDVGMDWQHELYQDVIDIADKIFFVFEPDIPFIQYFEESNTKLMEFFREQTLQNKSFLIGNRFDTQLKKNPLLIEWFEEQMITSFPPFSVTDVFQAQMNGIFLNDYKEYQKRIEPFIQPLIEEILPKEFIDKKKRGLNVFKGLFNKKITVEKSESKGGNMTV